MHSMTYKEIEALNSLTDLIHSTCEEAGWWEDLNHALSFIPDTPHNKKIRSRVKLWFFSTKIALIHSEASEMLEGMRKQLMDDHLPHREATEVEGADVFIRLADFMGAARYNLGEATSEKFEYNQKRADHKRENRNAPGGKSA